MRCLWQVANFAKHYLINSYQKASIVQDYTYNTIKTNNYIHIIIMYTHAEHFLLKYNYTDPSVHN